MVDETNQFGKLKGNYTKEEYDNYIIERDIILAEQAAGTYGQDWLDYQGFNEYGSGALNYTLQEQGKPVIDLSALGDVDFTNTEIRNIEEFERGNWSWDHLSDKVQQAYLDTVGEPTVKHGTYGTEEEFLNRWQEEVDRRNKYGSTADYGYDESGTAALNYDDFGGSNNLTNAQVLEIRAFEKGQLEWEGLTGGVKTIYLSHFDPGDIIASYDINGEPVAVSDAYLTDIELYTPPPITDASFTEAVVGDIPGSGIDTDVQVWKEPVSAVNPGTAPSPVTTTIEYNAINTDQPVDENPPTYSSSPSQNTSSGSNSSYGDGYIPSAFQKEPEGVTNINIPDAYDYTTYGLGKKADHVTTGYEPVDVSGLYNEPVYEAQELAQGNQWVYDKLTGRWVQQPVNSNKGGKIRHYNTGDYVANDYTSEDIVAPLSNQLSALEKEYNDPSKLPTWYGTQYNAGITDADGNVVGGYEEINNQDQNLAQWVAAGGDPNEFQGLSPIAGFNKTQLAAQDALVNASEGQGNVAQDLANSVQTGLSGGYGYDPNLQIATTLGASQGYDPSIATASQQQGAFDYDPAQQVASQIQETQSYSPAQYQAAQLNSATGYDANLQGNANYINQYLNPAIQNAQQQAIGNVNSSFGASNTLGSARNASAASRAATEASIPFLNQAYGQEFAAQQAINAANQGASNTANQFNAGVQNQADQFNVNATNTALQTNVANQNQASQFGASAANQAGALNQAALNNANAANQAAVNQAGAFSSAANNQIQAANQGAQNQFALANQGSENQAGQFNANNANQFALQNANILNQTDAANVNNANQASQFNLNNIGNWANQVANAQGALTQQGNTLGQVGQQQQDLAQQQTNQDVQAWNFGQNQNLQNLYNQLGLGQIAQAAKSGNIGAEIEGSGGGFDLGNFINLAIGAAGGGADLGSLLGNIFNEGGKVPQGLLGGRV